MIFGSFCILGICIGNHGLAAAQGSGLVEEFASIVYDCDTGPDAMTNAFGKNIPRTCIDVPYDAGDGSTTATIERCYYTFVPESCTAGAANDPLDLPVVFEIHGLTSCPLNTALYTGWMEKAEEECFVVVWPIGTVDDDLFVKGCWNLPGFLRDDEYGEEGSNDVTTVPCCCFEESDEGGIGLPSEEPNDPLFLRMAIDSVVESFDATASETSLSIDRSRVYMAGHSNGCMTSLSMAALHSDVVAAVCCHAGTLITPFPSEYSPVPIWMAHGMKDTTVPFNGTVIMDMGVLGSLGMWSTENVLNYIAGRNDCGEAETTSLGSNGATLKRTNCTNNANVELVTLYESGHFPYLPVPGSPFSFLLDAPVDTTALAWEFCSSHSNPRQQQQQQDSSLDPTTTVPTPGVAPLDDTDDSEVDVVVADDGDDDGVVNTTIPSEAPAAARDEDKVLTDLSPTSSASRPMHKRGTLRRTIVLGVCIASLFLSSSFDQLLVGW